jgi:hypothetical protein
MTNYRLWLACSPRVAGSTGVESVGLGVGIVSLGSMLPVWLSAILVAINTIRRCQFVLSIDTVAGGYRP